MNVFGCHFRISFISFPLLFYSAVTVNPLLNFFAFLNLVASFIGFSFFFLPSYLAVYFCVNSAAVLLQSKFLVRSVFPCLGKRNVSLSAFTNTHNLMTVIFCFIDEPYSPGQSCSLVGCTCVCGVWIVMLVWIFNRYPKKPSRRIHSMGFAHNPIWKLKFISFTKNLIHMRMFNFLLITVS